MTLYFDTALPFARLGTYQTRVCSPETASQKPVQRMWGFIPCGPHTSRSPPHQGPLALTHRP